MTTSDPKELPGDVARSESARQSRTTARDIPRLLSSPLPLRRLRSPDHFNLTASSRSEGVLKAVGGTVSTDLEPGTRLVLVPAGKNPRPVRFVVECIARPDVGRNKLHVRWVLISAAGKRSYLVDALTELLGLAVSLNSERDDLAKDRVLLFDAETRRIRAILLKGGGNPFAAGQGGASAPIKAASGAQAAAPPPEVNDARRNMMKKTAGTDTTHAPLGWLMFERPTAGGRYAVDGENFDMTCSWVGFSRCRFEVDGLEGARVGTALSVGVPTEPLLRGLVWLDGKVCLNTADPSQNRTVIEVEWNDAPGMMPSGYRSLVAYCRMSTLKRLGDREPQFIS